MTEAEILRDFFLDRLTRDRENEAIYDHDRKRRYRYGDLDRRSAALAGWLLKQGGVHKGDRVGILSDNCMAYFDLFFSLIRTGMILVSYNGKLTARELGIMMQNEAPEIIFYHPDYEDKARRLRQIVRTESGDEPLWILLDDMEACGDPGDGSCYSRILSWPEPAEGFAEVGLYDTAMLIHTGGSTGIPKAAMMPYATFFYSVVNHLTAYGFTQKDACYMCMPMYHLSCLISIIFPILSAGGRLVLGKKFCVHTLYEILNTEKLTLLVGVPGMFRSIAEEPCFEKADFSMIDRGICGAAPVPLETLQVFWDKGIRMCNCYGITEGSPGLLSMPLSSTSMEKLQEKRLSVGKPMIYTRMRILREDGAEAACGEKGELLVKAAAMFTGYWNNPRETALAFREGWLHTGDIALQDEEGYYYIVGRKKNMFISHGENIYPAEIENVLQDIPGVREVCVIGVSDEVRGEAAKALIVKEKDPVGDALSKEAVIAYAQVHLASIKRPKYVEFLTELPRNAMGKIRLEELKGKYGQKNERGKSI